MGMAAGEKGGEPPIAETITWSRVECQKNKLWRSGSRLKLSRNNNAAQRGHIFSISNVTAAAHIHRHAAPHNCAVMVMRVVAVAVTSVAAPHRHQTTNKGKKSKR
jgi:hypothetical protein